MTQKKNIKKLDKEIGKNLQKLRKNTHISRTQLANSMNVSYKTLWQYENGYNSISIDSLIKMRTLFRKKNITFDKLFEYLVITAIDQLDE